MVHPRRALAGMLLAALIALPACDSVDPIENEDTTEYALPAPGGSYAVGTADYHFAGTDRDDGYTSQVGDARPLMVQVWYPATTASGASPSYMHPEVAGLFGATQDYVSSEEFSSKIRRILPNAKKNAPVAASRWPVVFLSHGLGGVRALYSTYAEALAATGFVVVGIDHTFGALGTVFPDGRIVGIRAGASAPEFMDIVRIWADDIAYVLDRLEELDAADPAGLLTGRLDLDHVGAAGHSTGGSAAMEVASYDERIDAVATLDGVQVGLAAEEPGLQRPLLLMVAQDSEYGGTSVQEHLKAPGARVTIAGTSHYSFTDLPVLLDLVGADPVRAAASVRPPGSIDPGRNLAIQTGFLKQFFGRWLKGEQAPLLDGATTAWPEVTFEAIGG